MGQVPESKTESQASYLIIGSGRVARHFAHYLQLMGQPHVRWSRSESHQPLDPLVKSCDRILVLIKDSEIEPFVRSMPQLNSKTVIHFSGALSTPVAEGAHPLMAFAQDLYDLDTYKKMFFILEKNRKSFSELFPTLQNPNFAIESDLKPLYHSLCVMSGNFTVVLWEKILNDFPKKLGIPAEAAFPYMKQIFENLLKSTQTLTGPLQRGDLSTIQKNLEALKGDPFEEIYRSFVKVRLPDAEIR